MNTNKAIALCLLASVNGLKVRDIFDAYDTESALEQLKREDTIDPSALAVEIGGEDIARDVINATGGISESSLLQLSYDGEDADNGPSEKEKKMIERINNFRKFEENTEGDDSINHKAFKGYVDDVENTHSSYSRQINGGIVDSEGEPKESLA